MARKSPLGIKGSSVWWKKDAGGKAVVAVARVRDQKGKEQSQSFVVTSWRRDGSPIIPDAATAWAEGQKEAFVKGVTTAGSVSFQAYAETLAGNLERIGVSSGRIAFVRAISKGLEEEGIRDMKSDAFSGRLSAWLSGLKSGWSLAADAPNRRKTSSFLAAPTKNKILIVAKQVTGLAVLKRRLAFDPLAELEPYKEVRTQKPIFNISEIRQMVSDDARDHTIRKQVELEAAISEKVEEGAQRMEAIQAVAQERGQHWTTLYNILRRNPEADPWWLACCLLVYTGCRADEGMHLRWQWVDFDARIITLKLADDYKSKSDTERIIPLEPELADILRPIKKASGHILPPEIRAGGSGMRTLESAHDGDGAKDYTGAFRRYMQRIGIDIKDRTAHSLRHDYISMKLARADMNIDRLRKVVGHESFSTTKGYSTLSQHFEAEVDQWPDSSLWLRRNISVNRK